MTAKKLLPKWLYNYTLRLLQRFASSSSYAQEGEDRILARFVFPQKVGYYVDVGAHHPVRFSNTYLFYKNGWRGINIEPNPGIKKLFNSIRPRDVTLEIPIASKKTTLTYYRFNEPALNTFSKELAKSRDGLGDYRLIETLPMETQTLEEVLDRHLPDGTAIDLLSVDVEGLDLDVLRSNNWKKYLPTFVLVEDADLQLSKLNNSAIHVFLTKKGYNVVGRTMNTSIYRYAPSEASPKKDRSRRS